MNKFENAMKKRKNIDAEIVKELFPEDQNFYNRVKLLTTTLYNIRKLDQNDDNLIFKNRIFSNRANNKNTTSYSSFRNSFNISKKISPKNSPKKVKSERIIIEDKEKDKKSDSNEKDILKKIEEYKNEQYINFNKAIDNEKKKEKERTKKYDEEQDPEKKKKIEIELANERAESNKKIMDFQKNIDLNIKKYEEELRNNKNKKTTNNESDNNNLK
jgi:hypothetical protein